MMIKLRKKEIELACEAWLRGRGYKGSQERNTSDDRPVAIDLREGIICKHTRSGADCIITTRDTDNAN